MENNRIESEKKEKEKKEKEEYDTYISLKNKFDKK